MGLTMAKYKWIAFLFFLWISLFFSQTALVGIHRAIPRNSKSRADSSWFSFEPCKYLPDLSKLFLKKEAWFYSIAATFLVGMCGIFPLLVIPVEAGHALREGVTADHLKLLLSFAVGGLLGDVFLHLLPEAWAHTGKDDDPHTGHFYIGFWVIAGIFGFLTLEKIFGEKRVGEDNSKVIRDKDKEINPEGIRNGVLSSGCNNYEEKHRKESSANGNISAGTIILNGNASSKTVLRQRQQENTREETLEETTNSVKVSSRKHFEEEGNVKVLGYLNLLANSIDNFTHGLAVAGSFVVSTKMGLCTTCAILLHEIPHEIGDFAILLKSGFKRWDAAVGQMVTASAGLGGAIFGLVAEHAGDTTAWVLPFTSGGFIYIALVTIVPELLQEARPRESIKQMLVMVAGIACMGIVSFIH